MVFYPHKPGKDIIRELARSLYPSSLHCFREAISNSFDEGSKKVILGVSPNRITLVDFGKGIEDEEKFVKYGENLKEDYDKVNENQETIGSKGLGKLSLLRLQDTVYFTSSTKLPGHDDVAIKMTIDGNDFQHGYPGKWLDHTGTAVLIKEPFQHELPDIDKLKEYLEFVFSLRLNQGYEIVLNGVNLKSSVQFDSEEKFICALPGNIKVTGNIKASNKGKGLLHIFCKHVYVQRLAIDKGHPRKFDGWVNCNALKLITNRDAIDQNGLFNTFMMHLRQRTNVFEEVQAADPTEYTYDEKVFTTKLETMLKLYLKDRGMLNDDGIFTSIMVPQTTTTYDKREWCDDLNEGSNNVGRVINNTGTCGPTRRRPDEEQPHVDNGKKGGLIKTDKPIKRQTGKDLDLIWLKLDIGNDQDALVFNPPKEIIQNEGNEIFKFATISDSSLGPKILRIIPSLAKLGVKMQPDYVSLTTDQVLARIDDAQKFFLKSKGLR